MSEQFMYFKTHRRVAWCKAALEIQGWIFRSDITQEECKRIVDAWRQEEEERQKMGLNVVEYGIREAQMDGLNIWEAYII